MLKAKAEAMIFVLKLSLRLRTVVKDPIPERLGATHFACGPQLSLARRGLSLIAA